MAALYPSRLRSHLGVAVACGLALSFASAAPARSVIVRSTGPSADQLQPGRVLPDPLVLRLLAGDMVTVLDEQGTRELRGPATINETSKPAALPSAKVNWKSVLGARLRARAAGTRGKDEAPPLVPVPTAQQNLWLIDPRVAGTWCVTDLTVLGFWRADPKNSDALTLRADAQSATVEWLAGQPTIAWPDAVVPRNGARYTLALADGNPRTLALETVSQSTNLESLADQLADHGCYHQLGILVGS